MKLSEFYISALNSVGLDIDDENFLVDAESTSGGVVKIGDRITHNKQNLILLDSNMKLRTADIIIFNPLEEDSIKGVNASMVKYKATADRVLSKTINVISVLLAKLAADVELQKKASLELNKFISSLSKLRKQNMKEIVDDSFVNLLQKINAASEEKAVTSGTIHLGFANSKIIDGEKFNKVSTITFPIYDDLKEDPTGIFDISFKRNKDVNIYYSIIEFIIGTNDEDSIDKNKYTVGSNSLSAPSFIVMYKTYFKIATRLNKLLKTLEFIDEDAAKAAKINLVLKIDDLAEIENVMKELKLIPKLKEAPAVESRVSNINRNFGQRPQVSESREPTVSNRPMTIAEKLKAANGQPVDYVDEQYEEETPKIVRRNDRYDDRYDRRPSAPTIVRREVPIRRPMERTRIELPGDNDRSYRPLTRDKYRW